MESGETGRKDERKEKKKGKEDAEKRVREKEGSV